MAATVGASDQRPGRRELRAVSMAALQSQREGSDGMAAYAGATLLSASGAWDTVGVTIDTVAKTSHVFLNGTSLGTAFTTDQLRSVGRVRFRIGSSNIGNTDDYT